MGAIAIDFPLQVCRRFGNRAYQAIYRSIDLNVRIDHFLGSDCMTYRVWTYLVT